MSLDLSNIQLKDIKYLLAVYRMNSFRKASTVCGVSQATISGQIIKLERLLNIKLMERNSRKLTFTEQAKPIIEQFNKINEEFKILSDIAFAQQHKTTASIGEFNVGVIPTIYQFFVNVILANFAKKYPNYKFNVIELKTERICQELEYKHIDFAIAANHPLLDDLHKVQIGEDELVMLINNNNCNLRTGEIDPRSLVNSKIFILNDGNCLRDHVIGVCSGRNHGDKSTNDAQDSSPDDLVEYRYAATSIDTLKMIVANNIGLSVIPTISLQNSIPKNCQICPILEHPKRRIYTVFAEDEPNHALFHDFSDTLVKIFEREYKRIHLEDQFYHPAQ